MTDNILIALASFFGGSFLTAVMFIVGYVSRFATLEANVKAINLKLGYWEKNGMPTCSFHGDIEDRLRNLQIKGGE